MATILKPLQQKRALALRRKREPHERTEIQELRRARPVRGKRQNELLKRLGIKSGRLYYNKQGKLFFAKTTPMTSAKSLVLVYTDIKGEGRQEAACLLVERGKMLAIEELRDFPRVTEPKNPENKGKEIFRIVLNEAICEAKRKHKNISITAENEKLVWYYSKFGFRFESPSDPMKGVLWIVDKPRTPRMKK